MSNKERRELDKYWRALHEYNMEHKQAATAGELAKYMGIARNTARKYLKQLIATRTVEQIYIEYANGQTGSAYIAMENVNNTTN